LSVLIMSTFSGRGKG